MSVNFQYMYNRQRCRLEGNSKLAVTNTEIVILAALETSNEVNWNDIREQLTPRERNQMHDVMRSLKARGLAWRKAGIDENGNSTLKIVKGVHPNRVSEG